MVSDLIEIPSIDTQAASASIEGIIDPTNSSVLPLGAGGVFTGQPFDVTEFAAINVNVVSDVASATDGVRVQFSIDGVNWDHSHATTYSGATGVGYIFNAEFKFARVVYTNDGSAQAYFRLLTIFKKSAVKQSLYTIVQTVTDNMFAELGKNVIIGKTTGGGGGYVAVKVNPSGALTTEATLAAGNANIGDVDIASWPALAAGTNNIGDVDVATLPVSFNAGTVDATTQRVIIASDQVVAVSATSLPLPGGAATETTLAKLPKSLISVEHDQVVNTYVGATTRIATAEYKLLGTTVATLTFTYDGSNRLVDITRT